MKLQEIKAILLVVVFLGTLFFVSPILQQLLTFPETDFYSELYVLGSGHRADSYPFNITRNENYTIFLGVENHLNHSAYYMIKMKFCDLNQSIEYGLNPEFNNLPTVHNFTFFVEDTKNWELPIVLSFDYAFDENFTRVDYGQIIFNDFSIDVNGVSSEFDIQRNGFFGTMILELWIYNESSSDFQYHDRSIDLKFNMTALEIAEQIIS